MRPAGDILLELEILYNELIDDHGYQMADMIWNLYGWGQSHRPDCIEVYIDDGSSPVLEYKPRKVNNVQSKAKKNKKQS